MFVVKPQVQFLDVAKAGANVRDLVDSYGFAQCSTAGEEEHQQ